MHKPVSQNELATKCALQAHKDTKNAIDMYVHQVIGTDVRQAHYVNLMTNLTDYLGRWGEDLLRQFSYVDEQDKHEIKKQIAEGKLYILGYIEAKNAKHGQYLESLK